MSIAASATKAHVDPLAMAYHILLEDGGQSYLYGPVRNFAPGDCEVMRELLESPLTVPGLGDGGAHCTQICDVSFPTSLLTHWGRDRRHGSLFPIAALVRKQTSDAAAPARIERSRDPEPWAEGRRECHRRSPRSGGTSQAGKGIRPGSVHDRDYMISPPFQRETRP
jgi:hypothetical protein